MTKPALKPLYISILLATGGFIACFPVLAQTNASGEGDKEVDLDVFEKISVQARRRSETIYDVPVSMTTIGEVEIQDRAILDLSQIGRFSPNVFTDEAAGRPGQTRVAIRGIADRAGIYVDDVYVGDSSAANTLLVDVSRVEVLRGPQGAFFGRNTSAGAINFYTVSPSESFEGQVIARAGNYGFTNISSYVTGPLIEDVLFGKLVAGQRGHNGYETTKSGRDVNEEGQYSVKGQLLFTPNDSFSALLNLSYNEDDATTAYLEAVEDFGPLGGIFRQAEADNEAFDRIVPDLNVDSSTVRKIKGASLTMDLNLSSADITSITGYRHSEVDNFRDPDGGLRDIISGNQPTDYESISQEIKLSVDQDNYSWLFGLYYFNDKRETADLVRLGGDFILAVDPSLGPWTSGTGILDIQTSFDNPVVEVQPGVSVPLSAATGFAAEAPFGDRAQYGKTESESAAIYGSVTYDINDELAITAGGRFTFETVKGSVEAFGVSWFAGDPDSPFQEFEEDFENFSPSLSLVYQPEAYRSIYATYSKGFQAGGFNLGPGNRTGAERFIEPEKVTNYEIGLRDSFLDRKVKINVATFYQDYTDFQRERTISTATGQETESFNADTSVYGIEFDSVIEPIDDLIISFAFGYQRAEYEEGEIGVNTPEGTVRVNLEGSKLPLAPEFTASAALNYSYPLNNNRSLLVGADTQFRGSHYLIDGVEQVDLPLAEIESTLLLNANIGVQFPNELQVRFRIENILDEQYLTSLNFVQQSGVVTATLNTPRTYFIEISKFF